MDSTRWDSAAFNRFPQMRGRGLPRSRSPLLSRPHRRCAGRAHGMRCAFIVDKFPKQPDAILAMVAGYRRMLVPG